MTTAKKDTGSSKPAAAAKMTTNEGPPMPDVPRQPPKDGLPPPSVRPQEEGPTTTLKDTGSSDSPKDPPSSSKGASFWSSILVGKENPPNPGAPPKPDS